MIVRLRRMLRWPALGLMAFLLLGVSRDALHLNVAQQAATPYLYDLVGWEAANFFNKWVHWVASSLPWNGQSDADRRGQVDDYFRLGQDVSRLKSELERAAATEGRASGAQVLEIETELAQVKDVRGRLRNDVEETLEATISAVIAEEQIASWWRLVLPPVDIRLSSPPRLLVTSPRDRIERTHDVLLDSDIKVEQRAELEDILLEESDLSALVTDIGGVATYPASLPDAQPLRWTLQIAAHEWLHHYLFLKPLGQNMSRSGEMHSLNETFADVAGREIGDRAFEMLGGTIEMPHSSDELPVETEVPSNGGGFDFGEEMRATRLHVDDLLAAGNVEEAEVFMEERRQFFVSNGFPIRKLNQAYFAFHGTYAESPSSVSPIGDQLHEFRHLTPGLGTFIKNVSSVSDYDEFLEKLDGLRQGSGPALPSGMARPARTAPILVSSRMTAWYGFLPAPKRACCGKITSVP